LLPGSRGELQTICIEIAELVHHCRGPMGDDLNIGVS
jgi:hypothetical protein